MKRYNDFEYSTMSFGKYKGKYLKDVPTDYIKWLVTNIEDEVQAMTYMVELQRRDKSYRK